MEKITASLIISAVALLISALSWWEAHRNRGVSEVINRAVIYVASAAMTRADRGGGEFRFTAENTGRAVAQDVRMKIKTIIFFDDALGQKLGRKFLIDDSDDLLFHDIPAGKSASQHYTIVFVEEGLTPGWPTPIALFVNVSYRDEVTGVRFTAGDGFMAIVAGTEILTPELSRNGLPSLDVFEKFRQQQVKTKKRR